MAHEPELAIDRDVPRLDTTAKRALIETELRKDSSRSDREIARICGVDHKTVAKARGKTVPIASPPVSPWKPPACPPPPGVVDEPDYDPFSDAAAMLLRGQPPTAIYFNNFTQVVICQQRDSSDDDPFVFISLEHLPAVIRRLQQMLAAKDA
jgi:hypothetical protein